MFLILLNPVWSIQQLVIVEAMLVLDAKVWMELQTTPKLARQKDGVLENE